MNADTTSFLFFWGAALSSYQSEGHNLNTDWYLWEKENSLQPCGLACDHYQRFDKDFELASRLHLNSLRISLEWARLNTQPSLFSEPELQHYLQVVNSLIRHKLKPFVTLHHFTNPLWFVELGGWTQSKNVDYFLAYLTRVVELLKDKVDFWFIFNEPLVYIYNGFIDGKWPPGVRSLKIARKVLANILAAYRDGYKEIKRIYRNINRPCYVSLAKHVRVFRGCPRKYSAINSLAAWLRHRGFNMWLLDYLCNRNLLDLIGLNYYCKEYTQARGLVGAECAHAFHEERKNKLSWHIYPEGLYEILRQIKTLVSP